MEGATRGEIMYLKGRCFVHYASLDVYLRRTARQELLNAIKQTASPSDSVGSASAVKDATTGLAGPRYGRPFHRFGPPTALFSKPLALLKYNLEHLESYSPDTQMLDNAFDLIVRATDFPEDEDSREDSLKLTLRKLLPGWDMWRWPTRRMNKPRAISLEEFSAYVLVELKSESGLYGDPFLQGLIAYSKLITQPEVLFCQTLPNNYLR